jgi:signal transduction histidine kinase
MADSDDTASLSRAREQVAFLSRLAGGLAHEIKNPLSTMAINLALLEEDWKGGMSSSSGARESGSVDEADLSPRETRSLRRVRTLTREVRRLEHILDDFLRYARGGEVNRAPADLLRVIREVVEFTEPEHDSLGIRIHVELPAKLPLVLVDEDRIKQALVNLFRNAAQAMPDGGELLIRLRRVGNHVELTITDTGVGMSPEDLERCFELYWSTKKGGTGLGLATTRRIVEQHGGTISAVSEPGRGTSFAITLPLVVEITRTDAPGDIVVEPLSVAPSADDTDAEETDADDTDAEEGAP